MVGVSISGILRFGTAAGLTLFCPLMYLCCSGDLINQFYYKSVHKDALLIINYYPVTLGGGADSVIDIFSAVSIRLINSSSFLAVMVESVLKVSTIFS